MGLLITVVLLIAIAVVLTVVVPVTIGVSVVNLVKVSSYEKKYAKHNHLALAEAKLRLREAAHKAGAKYTKYILQQRKYAPL